jgi:hypothetical protein
MNSRHIFIFLACTLHAVLFASFLAAQEPNGLTVKATTVEPRKTAAYEFSFRAAEDILPDARFEIVLPAQCMTAYLKMATSVSMLGGLAATATNDTVYVQRSGLGNRLSAGDSVIIRIAAIVNPAEMNLDYTFILDHISSSASRTRYSTEAIIQKR